jgi:Ca2+-transporting ATPase
MGITGTDVTKNVADMVLADDNFATIVTAVGEGRRIYDNIRKTMQFLLSTNLSEVLCIFVATIMGFVLFRPVHLLYINLVTDAFPALALGMEHAEPGIMKRPPRGMKESVFSDRLGFNIVYRYDRRVPHPVHVRGGAGVHDALYQAEHIHPENT